MSDVFENLKGGEVTYAVCFPWRVPTILSARQKAYERARENYEAWSQEDGAGDAFRHAFAAALLARDISPGESRKITTLHEEGDSNPADRKAMDLHNNAVGIDIYFEERAADDCEPSDTDLEFAVVRAVREGRMKILVREPKAKPRGR